MMIEWRIPKRASQLAEVVLLECGWRLAFVIRHFLVIRHSGFVILPSRPRLL